MKTYNVSKTFHNKDIIWYVTQNEPPCHFLKKDGTLASIGSMTNIFFNSRRRAIQVLKKYYPRAKFIGPKE